jgi:signal peptidase I
VPTDGAAPVGGAANPAPRSRHSTAASSGDGRSAFTPTGKAVGRLRIQPRADSTPPPPKKGRWWELPVLAIIAVAVAVIVKTFIVQPFYIPSASMQHTLYGCQNCNGDKILVDKPIFDFRSPHPGDIIVFSRPDAWPADDDTPVAPNTNVITGAVRWFGQLVGVVPPDREDLVKRVIAVGGQTVKCCDSQGRVQVSDTGPQGTFRSLDEPYVFLDPGGSEMTFGPVTVPHGRLWVMGDHRTDSADSRYHCAPDTDSASPTGGACDPMSSTVPISHVIGKAFVIAWPPGRWRTLGTPSTFKASAASAPTSPSLLSPTSELSAGLPLAAGVLAVLPLFLWRRRTRW